MRIDYVKMDTAFNNSNDGDKFQFLLAFTSLLHIDNATRNDILGMAEHLLNSAGIETGEFLLHD